MTINNDYLTRTSYYRIAEAIVIKSVRDYLLLPQILGT